MTRILFVDDEATFLASLRSLLRRQRPLWELAFAGGGDQALDAVARAPFDAVVSDMRMPGMDGAELLQRVKEVDPGAARLVLSGYAEPDMMTRAMPVAHQYLSKPCPVGTLRRVLERVCELQRTLGNPALQSVIGRGDHVPALPGSDERLRRALEDPHIRESAVASIVERDPILAAKVLQLANSALVSSGAPVTSAAQAVALLGIERVARLPSIMGAITPLEWEEQGGSALSRLQLESIATARLAATFAPDPEQGGPAFTAGLLHEIGRVLLMRAAPDRMEAVHREAAVCRRRLSEVERELLGNTCAEIGGYLLGVWGLPPVVVDAVAYHRAIPVDRRPDMMVAALVHAADVLLDQALEPRASEAHQREELDLAALDALGFTPCLPRWRELAEAEVRAMAAAQLPGQR